jgi:hypothetical protein
MQITSANSAPVIDRQADLLPARPCAKSSPAQQAFSDYQSAGTLEVRGERARREAPVLGFTMMHVGTSVDKLRDSTRRELDDVAVKLQGYNVQKIEVNGYALFLREPATLMARAVKEYLGSKGVDQNLISAKGYGPGFKSDAYVLGKNKSVEIGVYGVPKDAANDAAASTAASVSKRSAERPIA